jgi:hypothetical protein
MVAQCNGGPSAAKPGILETVAFTAPQIMTKLAATGAAWALPAIGAIGLLTFEASVFCFQSLNVPPALTAAEYEALLTGTPPDVALTALGKLKDLVIYSLWFDICACTNLPTAAPPPTLLAPPANLTIPDYAVTLCASPQLRVTERPNYPINDDTTNITAQLFPNLNFTRSVASDAAHPATNIALIPQQWQSTYGTSQYLSGTWDGTANANAGYNFNMYGSNLQWRRHLISPGNDPITPSDRDPLSGQTAFDHVNDIYFAVHDTSANANPITLDLGLNITCSTPGAAIVSCGADPVLQGMLSQLLEQMSALRGDVTQLQRFVLPFAYVPSSSFAVSTPSGSQTLGRSVGLKIDVTAFPSGNKQFLGEPPYIFDLGWISVLTPDGLVDEIRLTREHTTWLSKLIPSATSVGWGLRDGVSCTITELHAEP